MDKEKEAREKVKELIKYAQPYVLFSGGKDSLVSLDIVREASEEVGKKVRAVHVDTTISLPDNLSYVEKVCKLLKVELIIVRPEKSYEELAIKKGFPTVGRRWCCYELKVKPLKNFFSKQHELSVIFDGVRANESPRRKEYSRLSYHKLLRHVVFHPILHWTELDVSDYIVRHSLPVNPIYHKGFRRASDCLCPAFKSLKDFLLLRQHYPELFNKLMELEKNEGKQLHV